MSESRDQNCCLPLRRPRFPSPVAKWCRRYCKYCRRAWPPPSPSTWSWSCCCPWRPRIHPATPENSKVVVRRLSSSGGVTNLSFQADADDTEQITFNNSSNHSNRNSAVDIDGSGEGIVLDSTCTPAEPSPPKKEWTYKCHASSLYLKTGPAKCIHVVHVKVKVKTTAAANSTNGADTSRSMDPEGPIEDKAPNGDCADKEEDKQDEEDDEEYWFSKWSNRPKLNHMQPPALPPGSLGPRRREPHRLSTAQAPAPHSFDIVAPEEVEIEISTDETVDGVDGVTNLGYQQESGDDVDGASTTLSMESSASENASKSSFPVPDEIINIKTPPKAFNIHKRRPSDQNGVGVPTATAAPSSPSTPKSPLLFFVHGLSSSSEVWTAQLDHFHARGYELVAVDLLGHGLSSAPPKPKFYTFESLLQDLVYVYDYFVPPPTAPSTSTAPHADEGQAQNQSQNQTQAAPRAAVLVGHGYGCCLISVLSRLRPHAVSALVSVSGGGPTPLAPPGTLRPPTLLPFQIPNIFAKKRSSARFDPVDLRHVLPPNIRQALIDGQIWLECDSAFHHRIQVPALLVYGLRDTTVALVEECEMEKAMPKAFLELLPTAGHFPMLDEPRRLNRMVDKFLQAWLPTLPVPTQ